MSSKTASARLGASEQLRVCQLVLLLDGAEIALDTEHPDPEFDAWLAQQGVETALFLPAHNPGRRTWRWWSTRQATKLQRRVDDARAVLGEQRLTDKLRPVPGLFVPGLTRSQGRLIARKSSVSTFFWVRSGQAFEAHQTNVMGSEEAFSDRAMAHARSGQRDLRSALAGFFRDPSILRGIACGSYWVLAAFALAMAGLGYALAQTTIPWSAWGVVMLPAVTIGLRIRQRHSAEALPEREFDAAEIQAAWSAIAPHRAAAWLVAGVAIVIIDACQVIWRGGDAASEIAALWVNHMVLSIWLIQAVSFSKGAADMPARLVSAIFGATFSIFGMKLVLFGLGYTVTFAWSILRNTGILSTSGGIQHTVNELITIAAHVSLLLLMLGFTWARERALFGLWLSQEIE